MLSSEEPDPPLPGKDENVTYPPTLQESPPTWTVTFDDFTRALVAAAPRLTRFPYPVFPLVFSCSVNGVWPTTCLGYMSAATRQYVDGRSNIVDAVAHLMMSRHDSWQGGRFTVTLDGAFRTRDRSPLARFELAA